MNEPRMRAKRATRRASDGERLVGGQSKPRTLRAAAGRQALWAFALALLPACYPALPMGGASRPRFYRSVLVDKVDYRGCQRVCEGARYAYCEVVTITSSALKSGPPRSGTVCFYGK